MNPTSDITIEGFDLNLDSDTVYIWYFRATDPQDAYREFTVSLDEVREWISDNIDWVDDDVDNDIYLKEELDFNDQEAFVEEWLKNNKEPELVYNTPQEEPVKPPPDSSQYARGGAIYSYSGFLGGVRDTQQISISANREKGTARVTCVMEKPDNRKAPLHISRKRMGDEVEKFWKDLRPLSTKIQSLSVGFDHIDWYENYGEYGGDGGYDVPVFYIKRGLKKVRIEENYETDVPKDWEIRVSCVFKLTKTKTPYMAFIEGCFGVGFTSTNQKKIEKELRKVLQGKKDSTYIDFHPEYAEGGEISDKVVVDYMKALEESGIMAKNSHKNEKAIGTIKSIISMPKQEIGKNPSQNVRMIYNEYNDWIQTYAEGGEMAFETEPEFDLSDDTYTVALGKIVGSNWRKEPALKKYLIDGGSKINLWKLKDLSSDDLISLSKTITTYAEGGRIGDRVRLIKMEDPYSPVEAGTEGTIRSVDDIGQLHIDWDNGRTLAIVPEIDEYELIDDEPLTYQVGDKVALSPAYLGRWGRESDEPDGVIAYAWREYYGGYTKEHGEDTGERYNIKTIDGNELESLRETDLTPRTLAKGGEVIWTDTSKSTRVGRKNWESYKNIHDQQSIGSFAHKYNGKLIGDYYLFTLDDYDRKFYAHLPLKANEILFRTETERGKISKSNPLIKINIDKGWIYFMSDENNPNSDEDDKTPKFNTKAAEVVYLSLDSKVKAYNQGLIPYEEIASYSEGGNVKTRYAAEADYYVYGEDDEDATREAKKITSEIDGKYDNKARVKHLHEQPFGTLGSRQVFDDGGEVEKEIQTQRILEIQKKYNYKPKYLVSHSSIGEGRWHTENKEIDVIVYGYSGDYSSLVVGRYAKPDLQSMIGSKREGGILIDVFVIHEWDGGRSYGYVVHNPTSNEFDDVRYKDKNKSFIVQPNSDIGFIVSKKYAEGGEIIKLNIAYLNKDKNHQEDRKHFKGKDWNTVYGKAVKWGQKHLDSFHDDMINVEYGDGGEIKSLTKKQDQLTSNLTDIKLNADLNTEKGVSEYKKKISPIKKELNDIDNKLEVLGYEWYADGGEVSLFFQQGSSDKEYHIQLEKDNGGYVVNFQYGRRGSALKSGTKTAIPVSLPEAQKIYDKLLNSKVAKGYSVGATTSQQFSGNPLAPKTVHRLPQLLNMVFTAKEFINDDSYLAQEKRDGERRMVVTTPNGTMGLNKKGQEVPLPNKIIDSIDDQCTIDGEIIGTRLYAFDILELNGQNLEGEPCIERISTLNTLKFGDGVKVVGTAYNTEEKQKLFDKLKREHREGIVFKKKDAPYTHGRPHSGGNQLKYKFYKTATFIVANITPGKRSVGLELLDNGNMVFMGKVTIPPNKTIPNVGDFVEVRYLYAYKGGAIFQPTYLSKRTDSDLTDATIEQIIYKSDKMADGGKVGGKYFREGQVIENTGNDGEYYTMDGKVGWVERPFDLRGEIVDITGWDGKDGYYVLNVIRLYGEKNYDKVKVKISDPYYDLNENYADGGDLPPEIDILKKEMPELFDIREPDEWMKKAKPYKVFGKANPKKIDDFLTDDDLDIIKELEKGQKKNKGGEIQVKNIKNGRIKADLPIYISDDGQRALSELKKKGYKSLVVGGAVRDALSGKIPKDIDIEVYGIRYKDLDKILSKYGTTNIVGKEFGVIKFKDSDKMEYDFSVPRRENKKGVGHKGFDVQIDPKMTPKQASKRRDFTWNALAYDPIGKIVYDYYGGIKDLKNGVMRATSEQFSEDPLRVLRAMQFQSRSGNKIAPKTLKVMKEMVKKGMMEELPKERVSEEWMKWATKGEHPELIFSFLRNIGLDCVLPHICKLKGVEQDKEWHPEGDAEIHTGLVMKEAVRIANREGLEGDDRAVLMFSALTHDFAKPHTSKKELKKVKRNGDTVEEFRITAKGHEKAGGNLAKEFLKSIGIKKSIIDRVVPLVENHLSHTSIASVQEEKGKRSATSKLARRLGKSNIDELLLLIEADTSGRPPLKKGLPKSAEELKKLAKSLGVQKEPEKDIILGRHLIELGLKPGERFTPILKKVREAQETGEFETVEQGKKWVKKKGYKAKGGEIELDLKRIKKKYPKAKVSYYYAKNDNGKPYVVTAKEKGKIVYSSYKQPYAKGGEVIGKSHAKGGERFTVKSTGQLVELEGGEGVLKKSAMDSEKEYTLKGTPKEIASCLNEEYDGVNFRDESGKCDITEGSYASGGSVRHSAGRKSPTESATWHIEGTKMKGNDGNIWCVGVNKNGIHRWVKCKP